MKTFSTIILTIALFLGGVSTAAAEINQKDFAAALDKYLESEENVGKIASSLENFFLKKKQEQDKQAAQDEEKELEEQFKNPVKIDIGNSPVLGKADAPITVIAFSDFQCPFCTRGADTMKDVKKEYGDKVKIVFKNLPLPFHPEAKPAGVAALAAHKQGKFWEMHDKLFENQSQLGAETYARLAKEIGLDVKKFESDIKDAALEKQVEEDAALASKLGVRGTPGFFVNGVQVRGARPLPYFKQIIDRWLAQ